MFEIEYRGHVDGVPLGYFTGASVTLRVGDRFRSETAGDPPPGVPAGSRGHLRLGRRASNSVRVASAIVGPHHLVIYELDEQLYVRDLGSTNGTTVGGTSLGEDPMHVGVGDQLTLAQGFQFEIIAFDGPAAAPATALGL